MINIRKIVITMFVFFCSLHASAHTFPSTIDLREYWQVISSEKFDEKSIPLISLREDDDQSWYLSSVPSTVLNVLVQNGVYPNIFNGLNLKDISSKAFDVPWWYRTSFDIDLLLSS